MLDAGFLAGFGEIEGPRELWRALGRFAAWVEPALVAEWLRLTRGYAARQGRPLDIDQCLPWSAWPCGDLWNLLPAHRRVNQYQKRDRLPGDSLLRAAAGSIQGWWRHAYLDLDRVNPLLPRRFADEARASLPGLGGTASPDPDEMFAALRTQRLRLRHDQQVPEVSGNPSKRPTCGGSRP